MAFYCGRRGGAAEEAATAAAAAGRERDAIIATLDDDDDAARTAIWRTMLFDDAVAAAPRRGRRRDAQSRTLDGRNRNPFHPSESLCLLQLLLSLALSFSLPLLLRSQFPLPSYFVSLRPIYLRRIPLRSREGGREGELQIAIASVHVFMRQVVAV